MHLPLSWASLLPSLRPDPPTTSHSTHSAQPHSTTLHPTPPRSTLYSSPHFHSQGVLHLQANSANRPTPASPTTTSDDDDDVDDVGDRPTNSALGLAFRHLLRAAEGGIAHAQLLVGLLQLVAVSSSSSSPAASSFSLSSSSSSSSASYYNMEGSTVPNTKTQTEAEANIPKEPKEPNEPKERTPLAWIEAAANQGHLRAQLVHAQCLASSTGRRARASVEWDATAGAGCAATASTGAAAAEPSKLSTADISITRGSAAFPPAPSSTNGAALWHALSWVEQAARGGLADAQFVLGCWYEYGDGPLQQSFAEAARWLGLASAQGHVDALICLGLLVEKGFGIGAPSNALAQECFGKAAGLGSAAAKVCSCVVVVDGLVLADRSCWCSLRFTSPLVHLFIWLMLTDAYFQMIFVLLSLQNHLARLARSGPRPGKGSVDVCRSPALRCLWRPPP